MQVLEMVRLANGSTGAKTASFWKPAVDMSSSARAAPVNQPMLARDERRLLRLQKHMPGTAHRAAPVRQAFAEQLPRGGRWGMQGHCL